MAIPAGLAARGSFPGHEDVARSSLPPVLDAHGVLAFVAIGVAAAAGVWGVVAYQRGRSAASILGHLLALAQTILVAQVALGLLLLSGERRATDDLHYAYGTLSLIAVIAPWLYAPADPRRRLLWFAVATLLAAALGVRAAMTGE